MSLKTIFKALIGTILVIVISSMIIEVFNLSTTGLQIKQLAKMSGKQACSLFSQETYKQMDSNGQVAGSVNMDDVYTADGELYVSGEFYTSTKSEDIYDEMYTSDTFKNWLKTEEVKKGNWYNLHLIDKALNDSASLNKKNGDEGYNEAMTAKLYREVMLTPSNLGIPYLDPIVLNKMFKWNLAEITSNCNSEAIRTDDNGEHYISFKGFKIYADRARISKIEYKVYDLTKDSDRSEFNRITNINPDKLGFMYDSNLQLTTGQSSDERKRVCLVGINYDVPISYMGITPIKSIFNYVWDNSVSGMNDNTGRVNSETYTEQVQSLQGGGLEGTQAEEGVLPVPGQLIYYIVR